VPQLATMKAVLVVLVVLGLCGVSLGASVPLQDILACKNKGSSYEAAVRMVCRSLRTLNKMPLGKKTFAAETTRVANTYVSTVFQLSSDKTCGQRVDHARASQAAVISFLLSAVKTGEKQGQKRVSKLEAKLAQIMTALADTKPNKNRGKLIRASFRLKKQIKKTKRALRKAAKAATRLSTRATILSQNPPHDAKVLKHMLRSNPALIASLKSKKLNKRARRLRSRYQTLKVIAQETALNRRKAFKVGSSTSMLDKKNIAKAHVAAKRKAVRALNKWKKAAAKAKIARKNLRTLLKSRSNLAFARRVSAWAVANVAAKIHGANSVYAAHAKTIHRRAVKKQRAGLAHLRFQLRSLARKLAKKLKKKAAAYKESKKQLALTIAAPHDTSKPFKHAKKVRKARARFAAARRRLRKVRRSVKKWVRKALKHQRKQMRSVKQHSKTLKAFAKSMLRQKGPDSSAYQHASMSFNRFRARLTAIKARVKKLTAKRRQFRRSLIRHHKRVVRYARRKIMKAKRALRSATKPMRKYSIRRRLRRARTSKKLAKAKISMLRSKMSGVFFYRVQKFRNKVNKLTVSFRAAQAAARAATIASVKAKAQRHAERIHAKLYAVQIKLKVAKAKLHSFVATHKKKMIKKLKRMARVTKRLVQSARRRVKKFQNACKKKLKANPSAVCKKSKAHKRAIRNFNRALAKQFAVQAKLKSSKLQLVTLNKAFLQKCKCKKGKKSGYFKN